MTTPIAAWPEPSWQAADEPAHRRTMNEREIGIEQMIRLGSGEYEMPEWALTQLRITTRMCDHELVAHIEELLRLGVEVASWPDRDTLARITAEGEYRDALEAFAALAVDRDGLLDSVQPDTPQAPCGLRVVR